MHCFGPDKRSASNSAYLHERRNRLQKYLIQAGPFELIVGTSHDSFSYGFDTVVIHMVTFNFQAPFVDSYDLQNVTACKKCIVGISIPLHQLECSTQFTGCTYLTCSSNFWVLAASTFLSTLLYMSFCAKFDNSVSSREIKALREAHRSLSMSLTSLKCTSCGS